MHSGAAQLSRAHDEAPAPTGDLAKLLEAEQRLAAILEAARTEAAAVVANAKRAAETAEQELLQGLATAAAAARERVTAETALELQKIGEQHAARLARLQPTPEERERLVDFVLARLLEPGADDAEPRL